MASNLAMEYLKSYSPFKEKYLDEYINKKLPEAAEIGQVNVEALKRFGEMAKLGKGIRGALIVLAYELCGGKNIEAIQEISVFIELFHSAILVHDDVQDQADTRRGHLTIHKQFEEVGKNLQVRTPLKHYGESMAIDIGDIGIFMSYEKLLSGKFSNEIILKAAKLYSHYMVRLAYGQNLDITPLPIDKVSEQDILYILKCKSAEYTAVLPLLLGATLAGIEDTTKLKALEEYGYGFGWSFQILDDVLGMYGEEKITGKPITADLREGKNTLLMLHLSQNGTAEQKDFQKQVFGNSNTSEEQVVQMRQILKDAGSYDYVTKLGWKYVEEGKQYIPQITSDKKYQDILEALLVYMMERAN